MRWWGNKKLRIALIAAVGVVLVLACFHKPPDPLRLKIVRTGIEDGKAGVLFRVEGGQQYELRVKSFCYILGKNAKPSDGIITLNYWLPGREFWAIAAPEYYADVGAQGWKVQAEVFLITPEKNNIGKVFRVLKDSWREYRFWRSRAGGKPSFLFMAKSRWNDKGRNVVTEETVTSDPITNTPPNGNFAQ